MKVRIVNRPSGLLNGRDWPGVGEVLEVTDEVGADMCAAGIGEPVVDDQVEKAVPSKKAETRKGAVQADQTASGTGTVQPPKE